MADPKNYESTVMRIAGNIAAQFVAYYQDSGRYVRENHERGVAEISVSLARAIVAEVQRTAAALPPRPDPATD